MSELRALLPLLVLLALGSPARSQGPAHLPAFGSEHLDSLLVELREARAAVERETAARRTRLQTQPAEPLDSARVGPLLVVARPADLFHAQRAFESAWQALAPLAGDAALPEFVMLATYGAAPRAFAQWAVQPRHFQAWPSRGKGMSGAADVLGRALVTLLSPELRAWLGRASLGGASYDRVYRELATSPAQASKACLAGDVKACAAALGIEPAGADWSGWYTSAQLREVVAVQARQWPSPDALDCARGSHAACLAYLSGRDGPPLPLSPMARASFLEHLIRTSGSRAFATLQGADGVVAGQLRGVSAAGSLERALGEWREQVLEARPRAHAGLARTAALTLLWIAILFGLARRSTRWRVG